MYVRVFIGVSARTRMSIYICTVFLKKDSHVKPSCWLDGFYREK
jgi:hypothetical protein